MVTLTGEAAQPGFLPARRGAQQVLPDLPLIVIGDVLAGLAGALAVSETIALSSPVAFFLVPSLWLLCVGLFHGYERPLLRPWAEEMHRVVEAGLALTIGVVGIAAVWSLEPEPITLLGLFLVTVSVSVVPRAAIRVWQLRAAERGRSRQQCVVVTGPRPDVERLVAELHRSRKHGLHIVTSEIGHLSDAVLEHRAAAVIAVPCAELGPSQLRRIGWELERTGTELFVAPGLLDVLPSRAAVASPGTVALVHVRAPQLSGVRKIIKDACERSAALLALVLLAPVLALVVVAIRLDSPGPAVFRQVRLGRHGRPFTMLKLRTMRDDAELLRQGMQELNESDAVLFKVREDPRVTRVGKVLRRYSIDEVPQLVNVVRGQMALVGPRPPLPAETLLYEQDVHRRFAVKPGVTGLWQVSGRSDLAWEDAVRLDLHYVDNWSLALDVRILARTARAVLRHAGAY